ncbi:hypothetical protein TQ32_08115 [Pyrococcus kukulkanii]|uniref:Uncharacterized protein n=1 Tax=Pyrococcus kukulkanii TaxID=1609559 RepID=A0A127BAT1_9EURY|nr:hypothetical protein TQ32_08115 [Pyrococcus kukulkanii]
MFVVIEGRRTGKLEKQERFIRIERAIFIGLFITLALFMLTGVLGFFDFVSRFKEPLDKILLFSPVIISIVASIVIADLMREEVEDSTKTNLLKAFLLASGVVFLLALAFVVIPALFPLEFRIIVLLALMLAVAEAFSRVLRRVEKGKLLEGELKRKVEELCRRAGVKVDGVYLIEDEEINAFVTGAGENNICD